MYMVILYKGRVSKEIEEFSIILRDFTVNENYSQVKPCQEGGGKIFELETYGHRRPPHL